MPTSLIGSRAAVVIGCGNVHRLHHALDHAPRVVGIEDIEAGAQRGNLRLNAELARAQAVKGADPARRGPVAEDCADAGGHLGGRLIGERGGEHAVGTHRGGMQYGGRPLP